MGLAEKGIGEAQWRRVNISAAIFVGTDEQIGPKHG
jgi:hypothetical protein